jgi:hypothetical protein
MTKCTTEQLTFSFFRKRQLTVDFEEGKSPLTLECY